jgi:hypothetical protein
MIEEPVAIMFLHGGVESGPGVEGRFRVFLGGEDHVFKKGERECSGKESIREDHDVRVIVLALIVVWSSGEEIGFIVFARLVDKLVIILS